MASGGSLGTLTLDLVAKIGGFTSGLSQAERESAKSAKQISDNLNSISIASYAVGNALGDFLKQGITAAVNAFPELIEQAAKFQDIADKTGGSAEGFANFAVSAKVAGVSIEAIADASTRLSKNLNGLNDDSKAAGAALKALGIPIADFKKLAPDEQIKAVANAFGGFADGAGKAAVAQQLFGKSGTELLKFFKDYTDNGGDVTILTGKMIQQADDFADASTRAKAQLGLYASAIATGALPAITALTGVLKEAIVEVYNLDKAASETGRSNPFATFAEDVGRQMAKVLDYFSQTKKEFAVLTDLVSAYGQSATSFSLQPVDDFKKKYGLNAFFVKTQEAEGKKAAQSFVQAYDAQLANAKRTSFAATDPRRVDLGKNGRPKDDRPVLPESPPTPKGGKGAADDPTKKLLDNDLKAFQAQGERAKELLADRNKVLDLYNSQGLLSVKDYYTQLQGNLDEATAAQAKSYDDQIAALKKFQAAAGKQTDVAETQGKINKLEEDKAKLYRQSGTAALESSIKQVQAQKAVKDAFEEVNAKVLEFQGNLRAAGEIRFDAANEKLITQAKAEQNDQVIKQIDLLKQYTLAQADINKLQSQFSLAQGDLQIAEERITIARERGTMGEIESLKASGQARREAVAIMQQQLEKFQAIDAAARTPEQTQAIERLKLQLEGLKATIDPLADKINTMFSDAAGSAFGDFITGTKTAKEAFKDFSKTVINEIARMAAKDLAKSLFGGSGSSGGLGSLFSSFLGGSSGGNYTAADMAGLDKLVASFASGGFTGVGAANDPAGIVHKGEYVLTAEQTKRIGVANLDRGNFGGGNVFNINVPESVSRNTGTQIAAQAQRKMMQGARNT